MTRKALLISVGLVFIALGTAVIIWSSRSDSILVEPDLVAQEIKDPNEFHTRESTLIVSGSVEIDDLEKVINSSVPQSFADRINDPVGGIVNSDTLDWRANRSKLKLVAESGALRLSSGINYSGNLNGRVKPIGGSLGGLLGKLNPTVPVRVSLNGDAEAQVSIKPEIQENWSIEPNLNVQLKVRNATIPIDHVGSVSVVRKLQSAANSTIPGVRDKAASDIRNSRALKKAIQSAWNDVPSVTKIQEDPPVWLLISPERVLASQPRITNTSIEIDAGLRAKVSVYASENPPEVQRNPFPDSLDIVERVNTESSSLSLEIPVHVSIRVLNSALRTAIENIPNSGALLDEDSNFQVYLNDAVLTSAGNELRVQIDLRIDPQDFWRREIEATMYMRAKPVLMKESQVVLFEEFRFEPATKSVLDGRTLSWIANKFTAEKVAEKIKLDVGGELNRLQARLSERLSKLEQQVDFAKAKISVETPSVERLTVSSHGVLAFFTFEGQIELRDIKLLN